MVRGSSGSPPSRGSPSYQRRASSRRSQDSRDEEQYTGELMGEWLNGLPPTMPFHRGQVLVIPKSPYVQSMSQKARRRAETAPRLKGRTDIMMLEPEDDDKAKAEGSAVGGPVEEEEGGSGEEKRLVYVSPAERQIMQECSELHDVLQHSQVKLVGEKTRRHRFLDGNRMSRGDLLEAKHWALTERHKKSRATLSVLGDLAGGASPRTDEHAPGGAPEVSLGSAPGATDPGAPGGKGTLNVRTPKPPAGPRGNTPGGPGGRMLKPGEAGVEPILRKASDRGDAARPATERGKVRYDEHDGHPACRSASGAETERGLSSKSAYRGETGVAWSEPESGKISLENFEQFPGKRIDSPHSVLAMRRFGVVQEDLERKPDEFYNTVTVSSLRGPLDPTGKGGTPAEEQSRLAQMRYEFDERARKRLIDKLMAERARHLKAYALLVMETKTQTEVPPELRAFGRAAQQNYLEGPQTNGLRKPVRGVMTYVDEMASALVEKGRQKVQRLQIMERKRMQAMLKSHITAKDRLDDLQERLGDKMGNREKLMEQRKKRMEEERVKKMQRNSRRHNETKSNASSNLEDHMTQLASKHQAAAERANQATAKVKRRLQDLSLEQAMKHERHQQRVLQAARAADFQKMQVEEKIGRAQKNYERLSQKREMIASERASVMHMLQTERMYISALVEGFEQTGEFKRPAGRAPDLTEVIGDIVEMDKELEICEEDRNEEAVEVQRNAWIKGSIRKGKYVYYKFKHNSARGRINLLLKVHSGDPDLYVGNHQVPFPTKDDHVWKCESPGQGTVIIHPFDKGFVVGYMYVGIYGYSNAEFSLKVRWSEPGDAPAEENSRASIKIEGGVNAEISAVSIQSMDSVSSSAPQLLGSSSVVEVMQMTWQGLCQWLQALDIDEGVVQQIKQEKVPGAQLANMTVEELITDLGMSRIQAKRVRMNIAGLVPSKGVAPAKTSPSEGSGFGGIGSSSVPSVGEAVWDPLSSAGGVGELGAFDDVADD